MKSKEKSYIFLAVMLNMVTFNILVEQDEDGMFIPEVIGLSGCHTQAKTLDELMKIFDI